MKQTLLVLALLVVGAIPTKAQTVLTQTTTVMCRSGELNCFSIPLKDSSGTLRGDYSITCNANALNNFTCHFQLVFDGETYDGKITDVTQPFPENDADLDDSGSFSYTWSAGSLTGSSAGTGHWGGCGLGKGYCAYVNVGTTVTVN